MDFSQLFLISLIFVTTKCADAVVYYSEFNTNCNATNQTAIMRQIFAGVLNADPDWFEQCDMCDDDISYIDCDSNGYMYKMDPDPGLPPFASGDPYFKGELNDVDWPETFTEIEIENTGLNGTVPWNSLPTVMTHFALNDNLFSGPLWNDSNPLRSTAIYTIDIQSNNFSGPLSFDAIGDTSDLNYVKINNNNLDGCLSFEKWTSDLIRHFEAQYNGFDCINLTNWGYSDDVSQIWIKYFYVQHNRITSELDLTNFPNESSSISLDFSYNLFHGSLDLTALPSGLKTLDVSHNYLSGTLDLQQLPTSKLETLYLNNNNFTGPINFTGIDTSVEIRLDVDVYCDPLYYCGDSEAIFERTSDTCYGSDCGETCVCAPTAAPTAAPTLVPTNAPTNVPTNVPSNIPSDAPTDEPTFSPTLMPSFSPTNVPTIVPTDVPSNVPTFSPTRVPTNVPTDAPSRVPSQAPTVAPTDAPTDVPTDAPTYAPTPSPTTVYNNGNLYWVIDVGSSSAADLYKSRSEAKEYCATLTNGNGTLATIPNATYSTIIEELLRNAIDVNTTTQCWIGLTDSTIENKWKWDVGIGSETYYDSDTIDNYANWTEWADNTLDSQSDTDDYVYIDTADYKWYITGKDDSLQCWICNVDDWPATEIDDDDDGLGGLAFSSAMIVFGAVLCVALIITALALGHAHFWRSLQCAFCCPDMADDIEMSEMVLYCLQVFDFYTDINFMYHIYKQSLIQFWVPSLVFTAVPWALNLAFLVYARRLWSKKAERLPHVMQWLAVNQKYLVILTAISGGAHASIHLCNSKFFAAKIFDMGLPRREVLSLFPYRFILQTTVENIPQLVVQTLYVIHNEEVDSWALLAMITSSLSVVMMAVVSTIQKLDPFDDIQFLMRVGIDGKMSSDARSRRSVLPTPIQTVGSNSVHSTAPIIAGATAQTTSGIPIHSTVAQSGKLEDDQSEVFLHRVHKSNRNVQRNVQTLEDVNEDEQTKVPTSAGQSKSKSKSKVASLEDVLPLTADELETTKLKFGQRKKIGRTVGGVVGLKNNVLRVEHVWFYQDRVRCRMEARMQLSVNDLNITEHSFNDPKTKLELRDALVDDLGIHIANIITHTSEGANQAHLGYSEKTVVGEELKTQSGESLMAWHTDDFQKMYTVAGVSTLEYEQMIANSTATATATAAAHGEQSSPIGKDDEKIGELEGKGTSTWTVSQTDTTTDVGTGASGDSLSVPKPMSASNVIEMPPRIQSSDGGLSVDDTERLLTDETLRIRGADSRQRVESDAIERRESHKL